MGLAPTDLFKQYKYPSILFDFWHRMGLEFPPKENSNILHFKITSTKTMVWTPDRQIYSSNPPQGKDMDP